MASHDSIAFIIIIIIIIIHFIWDKPLEMHHLVFKGVLKGVYN